MPRQGHGTVERVVSASGAGMHGEKNGVAAGQLDRVFSLDSLLQGDECI